MKISEIEWDESRGLDDLRLFGIKPLRVKAQLLLDEIQAGADSDHTGADAQDIQDALIVDIVERLHDIEALVERFGHEDDSSQAEQAAEN